MTSSTYWYYYNTVSSGVIYMRLDAMNGNARGCSPVIINDTSIRIAGSKTGTTPISSLTIPLEIYGLKTNIVN